MTEQQRNHAVKRLAPFIGTWRMQAVFPASSGIDVSAAQGAAQATFEWLSERRFVIQSWEVPQPAAPDGIEIIGYDHHRDAYLQHYFDSRGVARLYEMSFADGVWKLWRTAADFSPLDFSQRYTGTFSVDGTTIQGSWETSSDGLTWEQDFELIYTKLA